MSRYILKPVESQRNEFSVLIIELSDLHLVSDISQSLSTARYQLIDALQYEKGSKQSNAGIEMALDTFNYAYERSKGEEEKLSVIICEFKPITCVEIDSEGNDNRNDCNIRVSYNNGFSANST